MFSEDNWSFKFDIAKGKTYPRVEWICKSNCLNNYNIGNDSQANSKLWPNSSNLPSNIEKWCCQAVAKQSAVAKLTLYLTSISTISNSITNFTVVWVSVFDMRVSLINPASKISPTKWPGQAMIRLMSDKKESCLWNSKCYHCPTSTGKMSEMNHFCVRGNHIWQSWVVFHNIALTYMLNLNSCSREESLRQICLLSATATRTACNMF